MPDFGQRDDYRDGGGRAWGPRSDNSHGYGGAPRPSAGERQVESQTRYYDSQAFRHQSRPEAMGVRDSGARRDESPRRRAEPWEWRHRDEPQRRYDEPSRHHSEPQRRYGEPSRQHDEPQQRCDELLPSRRRDEPLYYGQRNGTLYDSGSLNLKRKLPGSAPSAAPTRRAGMPSSPQGLGRTPPAPSGIVNERMLSTKITEASSTHELLRLSATHSANLNRIHAGNLWNKLGKQRDASGPSHKEEVRLLLRRTIELLESCEARNLSNIAHGLAKCTRGLDGETTFFLISTT